MSAIEPAGDDSGEDLQPPAARSEYADLYASSREVERSSDLDGVTNSDAPDVDLPGFKFLTSLMAATPFSDYLHYKAIASCSHLTRQARVQYYCGEHRVVAGFCTFADLLLRVVVVLMVLGAIGAIAVGIIWRTFYQ